MNSRATACGSAAVRTSFQSRMYSPSAASQCAADGDRVSVREAGRGRVRERVERRLAVARVARPPAHGDLLRIHGVAHDEVARRRIGGQPGEQAHRQVEGPPPRVDRRGPPAVGRPVRRQDQRGLGRRGEIVSDLAGVVARVLVVLVQRHLPRHLLRGRVDLHRAAQRAHRRQHIPGDRADRAVRGERDRVRPGRHCARPRLREAAGQGRRPRIPNDPGRAAAGSPIRAPSGAAPRAEAPAPAGPASPPACPGLGCGRAACHTSRATAHRPARARPKT